MSDPILTNGEGKVRKILFNEVSLFFAFAGAVLSVFIWLTSPQQNFEIKLVALQSKIEATETIAEKLQNIKDNDLHEVQRKLDDQQTQLIEIQKAIVRLGVLIKQQDGR